MKGFGITSAQSDSANVFGIQRLPANGHLRLLRVIPGARVRNKWCQNCLSVLAEPFLALGKVNLEAVEAGEVPCRACERYSNFFVDRPDIAVDFCRLAVGRTDRLECYVQRIRFAIPPLTVIFAADRERNRPRGKIEQVAVNRGIVQRQFICGGVMQVNIHCGPGRSRIMASKIQERIKCCCRVCAQQRLSQAGLADLSNRQLRAFVT